MTRHTLRDLANAAAEFVGELLERVVADRMRRWLSIESLWDETARQDARIVEVDENARDIRRALNRTASNIRDEYRPAIADLSSRVPEVPPGGWKAGEGFMFGVGTVRTCTGCHCLVGGGVHYCVRCAREVLS